MSAPTIRSKAASGIFWTAIQGFGGRGVQFVVELLMARVLMPSDFGLVGMLSIFIAVSQTLVDSGMANALIQKQSKDDIEYDTVFIFNLVISCVVYLVIFFISPLISSFYGVPELTIIARVLSLVVIVNAITIISRAKLTIQLNFKSLAIITITSSLIAGTIGLILVYSDFGVYSLVFYIIAQYVFQAILSFVYSKWLPTFKFSVQSFKDLFSFGGNLLLANLLSNIYSNIYSIAIGRKYNSSDLGFYTKAEQILTFSIASVGIVFSKVTFPVMSSITQKDEVLPGVFKKFLRLVCFITFPISVFIFFYSKPIVLLLLTEKWTSMIIILQLLSLDWMWDPFCKLNTNMLLVKGYSKWNLNIEIVKRIVSIAILFISLPFGLIGICVGRIVYSYISIYINSFYTGKIYKTCNLLNQLKSVIPYLIISVVSGLLSVAIVCEIDNVLQKLLFAVVVYGALYHFMTKFAGVSFYDDIKEELLSRIKNI